MIAGGVVTSGRGRKANKGLQGSAGVSSGKVL